VADKDELIKRIADTLRKELIIVAPPQRVIRSTGFKKTRSRPKPDQKYSIKVLFAVQEANLWSLYIGGDRPVPIKIFSGLRTEPSRTRVHLTNLGQELNDWVVGFYNNAGRIVTIFGDDTIANVNTNTELAPARFSWIGAGNWVGYLEGTAIRGTESQTFTDLPGTAEIITTTATYSSSSPLLQCQGTYTNIVDQNDYSQMPASYSITKTTTIIDYRIENASYNFYKTITKKFGFYTYYWIRVIIEAGSTAGVPNKTTEDYTDEKVKPIFIGNNNSTVNYRKVSKGYDVDSNNFSDQTEETTITPLIVGCDNYSVYLEQNTITSTTGSSGTVRTSVINTTKKLIISQIINASQSQEKKIITEYIHEDSDTNVTSINAKLGATLIKNNFYLVAPSTTDDTMAVLYESKLWRTKRIKDYEDSNIYDREHPETTSNNILVWTAKISNEGVAVKTDHKVKVLGLLPNAKALSASYYT
jgi:hypothetical protein